MSILESINVAIERVENLFVGNFLHSNKEVVFIFSLVAFPVIARITPFAFITTLFVSLFVLYVFNHFYLYVNKIVSGEDMQINLIEYSWGFVRKQNSYFDFSNFVKYLKSKRWAFYKEYLFANKEGIIFVTFLFGDLIIAFKNLSYEMSGAYFTMSLFTKFVFLAYIYVNSNNNKIIQSEQTFEEKENGILDNFYKHFNGIASLSFVLFILFYFISQSLIEIFFGVNYQTYQTSLAFILLANMALLLSLVVFRTAIIVDTARTRQISKIYGIIFTMLFVFTNINYPDTVAFFVIGSTAVLSIFLYNFCIRKPAYIENTYNYLF